MKLDERLVCNTYIILWCVYYMQGTLYATGSIISQTTLMLLMLIGLFYFVKTNLQLAIPLFLRAVNLFLLIIVLYGMVYILLDNPRNFMIWGKTIPFYFIKNILMSFFPLYVFYYFSSVAIITEKWVKMVFVIFLCVTSMDYLHQREILLRSLSGKETTNNIGYTFLTLIPLLAFWRKQRIIQYGFMCVVFYFILMGMKRGAILIGFLCLVYFLYQSLMEGDRREKLQLLILNIISLIVGAVFLSHRLATSSYFNSRIEQTLEGNSSGRDRIYSKLVKYYFNEASVTQQIFGSGADYTVQVAGNFAHQDWLELMVDCGVIGVSVYLYYFFALVLSIRRMPVGGYVWQALMLCLIIIFLKSLFSMSYTDLGLGVTLAMGYGLAFIHKFDSIKSI